MKNTISNFLTSDKAIYADIFMMILISVIIATIQIPFLNQVIAIVLVLVYSWLQGGVGKLLGFSKPESIVKLLLQSFGIAFIFLTVFALVAPTVAYFTGVPQDISLFDQMRGNFVVYLIFIGIGWIVGGFIEETIYKGFMMKKIMSFFKNEWLGKIIAATVPATFFGFLHAYQGITGQIVTGLVGFGLAILYLNNNQNTWQNICVHGFINTLAFTVFYLNLDQGL